MRTFVKSFLNRVLDILLPHAFQARLGEYLVNKVKGQGCGDPSVNGEYWLSSIIKSQIREREAIVIDVGANRGEWSSYFADGMSNKLKIIMFEPVPATFALLKKISGIILPVKSTMVNAALGDFSGSTDIFIDINNPTAGSNSLNPRNAGAYGLVQKKASGITILTGDSYCQDNNINHIDFIKIDTEGNEYAVMCGFKSMLSKRRIDVIQFEYGGAWIDSRSYLFQIYDLLMPYGYVICRLHSNKLEPFKCYDQREETFAYSNYVAIRRERLSLFMAGNQ